MPKSKKPPAKGEGKPPVKPGSSKIPAALPKAVPTAVSKAVPAQGVKAAAPVAKATAKNGASPKPVPSATSKSAPAKPVSAAKPVIGAKPVAMKSAAPKVAKAAKVVEPPQPAEPRKWPKGGPTKVELKHYRDRLLEMRRALLSSSKELAAEALKSSGQDFSVDHMADHGSDNYEQDFSLKLLEGESEQLADIREALMKIDGKVETPFGICEACADDDQKLCETCPWIPPSRLEVLPHARLCVQTKEIEERRKQ